MAVGILSLLVAFGLGVLGVLGRTRTDEKNAVGRPTWVGWAVMSGLFMSFAIGCFSQYRDAKASAEREAVLKVKWHDAEKSAAALQNQLTRATDLSTYL